MNEPTFWDFLARSTKVLVKMGVPQDEVVSRRFAMTGHVRPIQWPWIKGFGAWGSVLDLDEIAHRVSVDRQVARDYSKARGLTHATRARRRTHAELAIELWCDRHHSPRESCERFGVYPGERRLLCAGAQVLIDGTEGGIDDVLGWTLATLDARFAALGVRLHPPPEVLRGHALTEDDAAARDQKLTSFRGAAHVRGALHPWGAR